MPLFDPDSDLVTGPDVPGAPPEPELETDQIQGVVLPGFGTSRQHLLGIRFADGDAARGWLGRWVPTVSSLAEVNAGRNRRRRALRLDQPRPRTPLWTGIALSADALRMLGHDPGELGDTAFGVGLYARAGLLGDPPEGQDGHPGTWVVGGSRDSTPHVLVVLGAETDAELDARAADIEADAAGTVMFRQRGVMLDGDKEHFGFRDGVSQVGVRGRLSGRPRHFLTRRWLDPAEPLARAWARPGQPLVWPGQFIFGLPTQDDHQPLVPAPPRPAPGWARNGSLLVFRRLRQDVPAFRRFTAEAVDALRATEGFADVDRARLEAALVGRWPDGTALARDERPPQADAARDMQAINHFGFRADAPALRVCADPKVAQEGLAAAARGDELREVAGTAGDPDGRRCPRFAHVRKVNPRDLPTDQGDPDRTLAFQMLRRGITWGAPYSEEEPAVAGDRGLLFMSWQSSIDEQFELLTTRWMNRGQGPEGNSGHDLLVGQARKREAVLPGPGGRTARLSTDVRWVVPTGGGYFFGPSLGTLAALAAG